MLNKLYTVEDVLQMDGEYELDRGVLVPVMPGGWGHSYLCGEVFGRVRDHVRHNRLGQVCCNDPGFILERNPDTLRGPDVAFVRAGRIKAMPRKGFPEGAPDLAAEVVGPGASITEAMRKATQYLDAGCPLVWIFDMARERVLVFRGDGVTTTLSQGDVLDGENVLPGFTWAVAEIFAEPEDDALS